MKRLILTAVSTAALLTAGSAFADNNQSTIRQTRSGDATRSVAATVDQAGARGSTSTIDQVGTAGTDAVVVQRDSGNTGVANGRANVSRIFQDNNSDVPGDNRRGRAEVSQNNDSGGAFGTNNAEIDQIVASGDVARIGQLGGSNDARIRQDGNGQRLNNAATDQTGANNFASTLQRSQVFSNATVQQTNSTGGPLNRVFIQQVARGFNATPADFDSNNAFASQNGSGLTSIINQTGDDDDDGGNNAQSIQSGDGSTSTINQNGTNGNADVRQANGAGSGGNSSTVTQDGTGARAFVDQRGTSNGSSINQNGSSGELGLAHRAEVRQTGARNQSTIAQDNEVDSSGSPVPSTGVPNQAFVTQNGNDNASNITQNGQNLVASVTQN